MRNWIFGLALLGAATAAHTQEAAEIEMWRLDCGTIELSDSASFSDGHLYDGVPRTLTDSCYVIRNGDRYLLWDAGLPGALAGNSMTSGVYTVSVERTIADQLGDIGLTPEQINFVGISHYHFDHIGQLTDFAQATLLINERDMAAVTEGVDGDTTAAFTPWLENSERATTFPRDHDVFGDGTVTMLAMPGHTPGHSALLVRLPETGNILLSGDLYHFREQIENRGVPQFNTDRADTLASFERFLQIDQALEARIVIQHDPGDVERLPAFPASAN